MPLKLDWSLTLSVNSEPLAWEQIGIAKPLLLGYTCHTISLLKSHRACHPSSKRTGIVKHVNYQPVGFEIATGAVAAVASALDNRFHHPAVNSRLGRQVALLKMSSNMPRSWSSGLAARAMEGRPHNRSLTFNLTTADLAQWNVGQYDGLDPDRRFDTIVIGVPSGATAHLCACLGAPLLADSFPISFASRGRPDDVAGYQQRSVDLLTPILNHNPDLLAVSLFDPIHARRQIRRSVQIYLKLAILPDPYRRFIRERLMPGGSILLLSCSSRWSQYELGARHRFQIGSHGGFTDQEFIRGTPWLDDWLSEVGGAQRSGWRLSRHWTYQPEAQWGSITGFATSVRAFAADVNIPLHSLEFGSVDEISRLGFYAWQWLYFLLQIQPGAVLIESGPQMNPVIGRRSPVLPLWMPSTCSRSHALLQTILPDFPPDIPILFQVWPASHSSPDVIPAKIWNTTLSGRHGRWLGGNPLRFPNDFSTIVKMTPAIEEWCQRHPIKLHRSLRCDELGELRSILAQSSEQPGASGHSPQVPAGG